MTVSDNVALAARGSEKADVMLRTAPSIGLSRNSGRLRFNADYSPVIVGYLNGSRDETLLNSLISTATLEAIDNTLFVDARASVQQTFVSPFGARPTDVATPAGNRTEVRSLTLSPYHQGRLPSGWGRYTLRHDITVLSTAPAVVSDSVFNRSSVNWNGEAGLLFSPSADYSFSHTQFGSNPAFTSQIARFRLTGNFDPEFNAFLSAGYEAQDLITRTLSGTIYGAGFTWTPRPRTTVSVSAEDRYYGASYSVSASHQTRMSAWRLSASRGDQLLQGRSFVSPTASAREQLDELLRFTIPDPAARAQEVERLLQSGTSLLAGSNNVIFNTRVNRVESVTPSVAFTGVRNTLTFSAFTRETTPISSSAATSNADPFLSVRGVRQSGWSISDSWLASETTSLSGGIDWTRSTSFGGTVAGGTDQRMTQKTFRVGMTRRVGPASSVNGTFRTTQLDLTGSGDVRENAIILLFTHNFYR